MTGIVRGTSLADSGASAATGLFITLGLPAGTVSGDQLLVGIELREAPGTLSGWRAPAGWALLGQIPTTGTGSTGTGYVYGATYGTDVTGSSWTWDNGAGNTTGTRWTAELHALDGSQVGSLQNAVIQQQPSSSNSQTTPALTTTGTTWLVAFAGSRLTGGVTYTWPAGWTEQADAGNGAVTNGPTLSMATKDATASAGSQSVTATASAAVSNGFTALIAYNQALAPVAANLSGTGTLTATVVPTIATSAPLSASGTLSATTAPRVIAVASASGDGTLTATAIHVATAALSGSGTLTAAVGGPPSINANLSGTGTLTAQIRAVSAGLTATGTLTATLILPPVDAQLSATGTLTAVAVPIMAAALSSTGSLTATYSRKVFAWVLRPPTQEVWFPIAGRGLHGKYDQGLTVYRVGGVWKTRLSPGFDELSAADRAYAGGYLHQLSDAERADLIAGGFGSNITYEEVPAS